MEKFTDKEALDYHSQGKPGKIEIIASKPMATQRDLALAYSPGVAETKIVCPVIFSNSPKFCGRLSMADGKRNP